MNFNQRRADEVGASSVEYGMVLVAIAAVVTLIVFALGSVVNDSFKTSCDRFSSAASQGSSCV